MYFLLARLSAHTDAVVSFSHWLCCAGQLCWPRQPMQASVAYVTVARLKLIHSDKGGAPLRKHLCNALWVILHHDRTSQQIKGMALAGWRRSENIINAKTPSSPVNKLCAHGMARLARADLRNTVFMSNSLQADWGCLYSRTSNHFSPTKAFFVGTLLWGWRNYV